MVLSLRRARISRASELTEDVPGKEKAGWGKHAPSRFVKNPHPQGLFAGGMEAGGVAASALTPPSSGKSLAMLTPLSGLFTP